MDSCSSSSREAANLLLDNHSGVVHALEGLIRALLVLRGKLVGVHLMGEILSVESQMSLKKIKRDSRPHNYVLTA